MITTGKKMLTYSPRETDNGGTAFSFLCLKPAYTTQKIGTDPWKKRYAWHNFSRLHRKHFTMGWAKSGLKFGTLRLHYKFWGPRTYF